MAEQSINVTFDQMVKVYELGIIGTKEFREWLSLVHPTFGTVRDRDVDDEIVLRARYNRQAYEQAVGQNNQEN